MRGQVRTLVRLLVIAIGAVIAFMAMRSNDQLHEIAGAVLLVLLAGWVMVDLFRARKRLVR